MAVFTPEHVSEEVSGLLSLGSRIEELFVQQYDRIAFHNNDEENFYRKEEERLSSLMVDRTLTNEKHLEHAQAILALTEKYTGSVIHSLHSLNADIDRYLAALEQAVDGISVQALEPTAKLHALLESLRRWISLSKELYKGRQVATQTIVMRIDCDKVIPSVIITHGGNADTPFTAEEGERFQQTLAKIHEMLRQSFEDNERVQKERLPLAQVLFKSEDCTTHAEPATERKPEAKTQAVAQIHPLEGKAWFRLSKFVYICLWILAAGLCLFVASSGDGGTLALGTGVVSAVVLILLRKGFYYVMLGRTTVTERPGTGFLDWDELNNDFDSIKANNPEFYQTVVGPFLSSWREQYGRRVPIQAYEVFRQRVNAELEELRTKKQKLIGDAAKNGSKIEIAVLRENIERPKQNIKAQTALRMLEVWTIGL